VYKKDSSLVFRYPNLVGSSYFSHKIWAPRHKSLTSCGVAHISSNYPTILILHNNIRCIKIMIRHIRNMRIICMNLRSIIGMIIFFLVFLPLVGDNLYDLDKFFAFVVHSCIVLVFFLVPNVTLDMRSSCIKVYTSCILNLLILILFLLFLHFGFK
jgi:hypothetical protein